jgi:hypothetical protein
VQRNANDHELHRHYITTAEFPASHMVIHHIVRRSPSRQRVEIELRKFERPGDAAVDVVALLKVDVLKKVADPPRGNGVAIRIDFRQLRDRAFDRHQALAKIFVDCGTDRLWDWSIVGLKDDWFTARDLRRLRLR